MAAVETPTEFRAEAKYVRAAPRKAQLVVAEIRGLPVGEARTVLTFMTRAAARDVAKVLASAVANAENHPDYNGEDLVVSAAVVGSGPTLKRWRARARGRVGRIKKRTCHITIRLTTVEPEVTTRRGAKAAAEAPKRTRRAKAEAPMAPATEASAAGEPEAEAVSAEVEAPAEEKPKPARTRRAKPKPEEEGAAAPAEEKSKPTRTRRAKPKPVDEERVAGRGEAGDLAREKKPAEATDTAETAEKPKRASRKKPAAAAKADPETSDETTPVEGDDN